MITRSSFVAGAAAAAVGAIATPGFAGTCHGVNAHQASNDALDRAAAAGIGSVRYDMNWKQFEPAQGAPDFTDPDRFINHATSLGLEVFVTVAYTPPWAVGAPCNDADPDQHNWCMNRLPADPQTWADFVTQLVLRYGDRVKHWGMWNEPNLLSFFSGTRDEYVNFILVPGSAAVHAACSDCLVVGPELSNLRASANWDADAGTCAFGNCIFNGWDESLKHILQDAGSSLDIVSHHRYQDPASAFWTAATDGEFNVIKITDGLKELTDAYVPGKPVWITEVGWESEPFGDSTNAYAASQLTELYQGFANVVAGTQPGVMNQPWPELARVFWYDLNDDPSGYSWGLLDSNLQPKPPYDAYSAVILANGCPGGGGSGGSSTSSGAGAGGTSSTSSNGSGGSGAATTSSAGGASAGPGGAGAGMNTGTGGTAGAGGGAGANNAADQEGGCATTSSSGGAEGGLWIAALALVSASRRRRTLVSKSRG